jgi:hypothetical protein
MLDGLRSVQERGDSPDEGGDGGDRGDDEKEMNSDHAQTMAQLGARE